MISVILDTFYITYLILMWVIDIIYNVNANTFVVSNIFLIKI